MRLPAQIVCAGCGAKIRKKLGICSSVCRGRKKIRQKAEDSKIILIFVPAKRELSSAGLERLLHTQEVSSPNLLVPTESG